MVFTPGNVYLNGIDLTGNDDDSEQNITILQDALLNSEYTFTPVDVPQDLYIAGDVINENGNVTIDNREGSINVTGIIRGEEVTIESAKNFSLSTDGWYHTNQDPRQYIEYTQTRNLVFTEGLAPGAPEVVQNFTTADGVTGFNTVVIPGPIINLNGNMVMQPSTTINVAVDPQLDEAIARDESRILAQGRITITAKYLNINGLIQSGTDNVRVDIAANFVAPTVTTSLVDGEGVPLAGITLGDPTTLADDIPIDGYWDAANNRIVIEEIVPQGGEIILAGQIVSTGNGLLRVANGYTNVNINNNSTNDIYIERIDVTTDKVGRIQITDTSTPNLERIEYTYRQGMVIEQLFNGTVLPANPDGLVIIEYAEVGPEIEHAIVAGADVQYQPTQGSQYVWVEGQEKTQTEVRYYKRNTFNLFGGGTWIDDALVGDESYLWRTFAFTDEKPLLESEGIVVVTPGSAADDLAYEIRYKTSQTSAPIEIVDDWETGGGWLREKSYHKLVTTTSGLKDFYTHTLEADIPIGIDFVEGPDAPSVNIVSAGSVDFGEINVPDTVASSVSITTTTAGANILQDTSAGIFGTNDVTIDSQGSLRANIEGQKTQAPARTIAGAPVGAANAPGDVETEVGAFKASGDIWIGFFETEADQVGTIESDRQVVVDYIWSTDGNVFVAAPDGIIAKDANSFIIGNQVELYAKEGAIGSFDKPIFIDSDVHGEIGDGGVLAWAQDGIFIREIQGDLFLAQQLDLAAGFDVENPEGSEANLKSTYDEIRPRFDGTNNPFDGSIHSTTGNINIEVVGGSVFDAIEEGFVPLTPDEIEARNQRLGLTGAAGEAAALAELEADARAKTESYHKYWNEYRDATNVLVDVDGVPIPDGLGRVQYTTPAETLTVTSVDDGTEILTFGSNHNLTTGDQVFASGITDGSATNLQEGAAYYAIVISDTEIQLAETRPEASISVSPLDIMITSGTALDALQLIRYNYTNSAFEADIVPSSITTVYDSFDTPAVILAGDSVSGQEADTVEAASGEKYIYVGTDDLESPDLSSIDFENDPDWELIIDSRYGGVQSVERAYENGETLFGDPDIYDPDFVFTYSQAEIDAYVEANTFDLEALENPVSPGLMKFIYPHAEFGNSTPNSDSTEFANITGSSVSIVAGTKTDAAGAPIAGQEGSIGQTSGIVHIQDPVDFESLSDEAKIAMSNAAPDDVLGVHYKIYQYNGATQNNVDLIDEDFSTGTWTEITTDFFTSQSPAPTSVSVTAGQTVLVQIDAESYGLYQATQSFTNINLLNKAIYESSGWERLTDDGGARADHDTNSGNISTLASGDIVLDKYTVQNLTLQLFDDIDLKAQDLDAISLGANAGDEIIIQTTDNLKVHHVLAGGDVRLQASSSSAIYTTDNISGGSITGDGTIADGSLDGNTADPANDIAVGTLGDLTLLADNSIGTEDSPLRIQIAPTGSLSVNVSGQLYLHQIAGTTLDIGYFNDTPETTPFNPLTHEPPFTVTAAEIAQFDYVNSATEIDLPDVVTIASTSVAISDLTVENASAGGNVVINILDETGAADTGSLIIGKITAGESVDLRAPEDILDLFDDAIDPVMNIVTDGDSDPGNVYLEAGGNVGTIDNFFDVSVQGELTGLVTGDVYIYSPTDLAIGGNPDPANTEQGLESSEGNISLLIDGIASVGLILANGNGVGTPDGLVTIKATNTIVDRRGDGFANIDANAAILKAENGIGAADNALDTNLDQLEAIVPNGGIWIDNESALSIGEIIGNPDSGFNAGGIYDDIDTLFDTTASPFAPLTEEVGVYASGVVDISNIGDLTLTSTTVSDTEVLMDVTGSILDNAEAGDIKDIIAPEALLIASVGVGTTSNEIETLLERLEGTAGSGGFFVDDMMGLVIGDVLAVQDNVDVGDNNAGITADGTIRVTTTGYMTVRENVTSNDADVTLHAIDSPLVGGGNTAVIPQTSLVVEDVSGGDNFEVFHTANDGSDTNDEDFRLVNGAIVRAATDANILGGDDVLIDADTSVIAGDAINIRGDHGNADTNADEGARIDILGTLSSSADHYHRRARA